MKIPQIKEIREIPEFIRNKFSNLKRRLALRALMSLPINGYLSAERVYADGTREVIFDKKNVITLVAKQNLLSAIYLTNQQSDPITTLNIGTGGDIDPEGQFPKPISQSITSLFTPLLSVSTSFTINNAQPSVTFLADVDQATANGQQINEAGLATAAGVLFNILTFPAIPKSENFSIHFEWSIEFA